VHEFVENRGDEILPLGVQEARRQGIIEPPQGAERHRWDHDRVKPPALKARRLAGGR